MKMEDHSQIDTQNIKRNFEFKESTNAHSFGCQNDSIITGHIASGKLHCILPIGWDWKKANRILSSVQLLSHVRLIATPWIAARQASLSITSSLCSTVGPSWLSIFKYSNVYMSTPNSLILPSPNFPPGNHTFTLLSLYFCITKSCENWPEMPPVISRVSPHVLTGCLHRSAHPRLPFRAGFVLCQGLPWWLRW